MTDREFVLPCKCGAVINWTSSTDRDADQLIDACLDGTLEARCPACQRREREQARTA